MNPPLDEVLLTWATWAIQAGLEGLVWVLPYLAGALLTLVVAAVAARLLGRWVQGLTGRLGPGRAQLLRRAVVYAVWVGAALTFLNAAGASAVFTWVAGAAGILGVALGFASQTSAANVISGLFLLGERPFEEGDIILIGDIEGEVLGIDLLSLKIRTFQNAFVRVPNETVMRGTIINLTRFPIRRCDLIVRVRPGTDLDRVKAVAVEVAESIPVVLNDPPANVFFLNIVEGGIEMRVVAWASRESFFEARAAFATQVVAALEKAGLGLVGSRREVSVVRDGGVDDEEAAGGA